MPTRFGLRTHVDSEYGVTSDSDYTFIQVKSDSLANGTLTEVIRVTKRLHGKETLEDLLLKVVDETLKQVFRETGTKVIYGLLENNSHLKREEIAEKPKVFSNGLKKMLGSGAPVIENLILKNLHRKLESKFEAKKGYEFSDYVRELRKRFEGLKV